MKIFPLLRLSAICLPLLVTGCGLWSSPPVENPAPPSPVVAYMTGHIAGDTTTLEDTHFGGTVHLTMQDGFISASGEICKRATLVAQQRQAEVVVICRNGQEPWRLAPRIWGEGIGE